MLSRRKLSATVEQGSAQQEGGGAAVLANLHSYYSQFLSLVQAAVTSGIAPLEKSLQVSLHFHCSSHDLCDKDHALGHSLSCRVKCWWQDHEQAKCNQSESLQC